MIRVGTDIVSIQRIKKSLDRFKDRFIKRYLTDSEISNLSSKPSSLAGYWASKEALSKALGCGIGSELSFYDIEIFKDNRGSPHIRLEDEIIKEFNIKDISLSISHDGGFAIAVVAVEVIRDE